jgi:hypothetical protein
MTKLECANALSAALTSTSKWRLAIDQRYPDHRNLRAARMLDKLAGETSGMTDELWERLEPHFGSPAWGEAVKQVARLVGYRKMSLRFFLRTLAGLLSATPASAA